MKLEAKIDDQEHKKKDGSLTYNPEWVKSGDLDLGQFLGKTINIGFKYSGTKDFNTTYEIDNIIVDFETPTLLPEGSQVQR